MIEQAKCLGDSAVCGSAAVGKTNLPPFFASQSPQTQMQPAGTGIKFAPFFRRERAAGFSRVQVPRAMPSRDQTCMSGTPCINT